MSKAVISKQENAQKLMATHCVLKFFCQLLYFSELVKCFGTRKA